MTTFTSDDREEAYKKIVDAAPNQPGYEDAVPIPFAGWVDTSPPHIVDLTDEQIGWFAKAYTDRNGKLNIIDFARAVLRKAQEK